MPFADFLYTYHRQSQKENFKLKWDRNIPLFHHVHVVVITAFCKLRNTIMNSVSVDLHMSYDSVLSKQQQNYMQTTNICNHMIQS